MYKYVMIYYRSSDGGVCADKRNVCACPGVRHFHRVETRAARKAGMLKSGEGILDEGVSTGYNRKLSGSTEKSLQ